MNRLPALFLVIAAAGSTGGCGIFGNLSLPVWFENAPASLEFAAPDAFLDVSDRLGQARAITGWGGLAAFDYDNDGDIDLLVTKGPGAANSLFENDGAANFTEVAARAGLAMPDENCSACAVGDFNNDGWLDLLIARQRIGVSQGADAGTLLMLNNGRGDDGVVTFTAASPEVTGLRTEAAAMSLAVGDLDNDGLLDVVIGRYDMSANDFLGPTYPSQPNELWRCTGVIAGTPRFERLMNAGVEGTEQAGASARTAEERFVPGTNALYLSDVDGDGLLDIFDCHDIPGGIDLLHNNGDMTFTTLQADTLNKHGGWMGAAGGDYDGDGDLDYFITNNGGDWSDAFPAVIPGTVTGPQATSNGTYFHMLLRNDAGTLTDVSAETTVATSAVLPPRNALGGLGLKGYEFGFGCVWIDADNRGSLDLYWIGDLMVSALHGMRYDAHGVGRFLSNNGDGSFADMTAERGLFDIPAGRPITFGQNHAGRALASVDLNGDGFRDLVLTNASQMGTPDAAVRVFLNPATTANHWLTVRLVGTSSNRFGIGAMVRARVGATAHIGEILTTTSSFTGVQPEAHFGLGDATSVDRLEIAWPSGARTVLTDVQVDQILTVNES